MHTYGAQFAQMYHKQPLCKKPTIKWIGMTGMETKKAQRESDATQQARRIARCHQPQSQAALGDRCRQAPAQNQVPRFAQAVLLQVVERGC